MNQADEIAALIRMLERVVTDGAVSNRKWNQFEQIEFLTRLLKSGQADPELTETLQAFNRAIVAPGKLRPRGTDSEAQGRSGLTARAMRLADDLFAHLSPGQRDKLSWQMGAQAALNGSPRPLEGRQG